MINNEVMYRWEFVDFPNYKIAKNKKIVNTKTGRTIKCCLNGGSVGYWIKKKFVLKSKVNSMVKICKNNYTPF